MPKSESIELALGLRIPVLYEDRSVLAIDKPYGWMLAPDSWTKTGRNLQAALKAGIVSREFWARSRNLKFVRFVHRLDAETTGIVLLAKSQGAVPVLSFLFQSRAVEKTYLAVVHGVPRQQEWVSNFKLSPDPNAPGKMRIDSQYGKEAETHFKLISANNNRSLIEVKPVTGRTHQIRVHLARSHHPVVGDSLYGPPAKNEPEMALRAVGLRYRDPFTRKDILIEARTHRFLKQFGFDKAFG